MKRLFLITLLLCITTLSFSQTWVKNAEYFQFKRPTSNTWSNWERIDVTIEFKIKEGEITIYSEVKQMITILTKLSQEKTNGRSIFEYLCKTHYGNTFRANIILEKDCAYITLLYDDLHVRYYVKD